MKQNTFRKLPPAARAAIIVGAVADVVLRGWALVDLVKRPEHEVNGPKKAWAPALGLVSSAGVLPLVYLKWGRTTAPAHEAQ